MVFLEEESDSSSASDSKDSSAIDALVNAANEAPEEDVDYASAYPNQDAMSPMEDATDDEDSEESQDKPLSDYDLSDAENYFNRQNGAVVCRKCGLTGHRAAECPNVKTLDPCFQCAQTDHLAKDCPTNICRQSMCVCRVIV